MNSLKQAPRVNIVTNLLQEKKGKLFWAQRSLKSFHGYLGRSRGI